MLKYSSVSSRCVSLYFGMFFSLFSICEPLFSNNALSVHSTFSSVISDSLLPNQFLRPPIFLVEGLFSLSNAKPRKCPLIPYHFPFFLFVLFSPISLQMLIKISPVRALPNLRSYPSLYLAITFFQPLLCSWQHFLTFSVFFSCFLSLLLCCFMLLSACLD